MEEVKKTLRESATKSGAAAGPARKVWDDMFRRYDADGSGELEMDEFTALIRQDCDIAAEVVSLGGHGGVSNGAPSVL